MSGASESIRVSTYLCMTKDVGVGGNLFGGVMMAWMDEAAAIYAHQYTGCRRMVTLRYTELLFKKAVRVNDIVEIFADNPRVGRTSITFDLEGRVENTVVFHTTCTFVAIDSEGKPSPIPARA
jgi:acyl-CoA thioesterase YciA